MALETINKLKEAEEKAENIELKAIQDAKDLVTNAKERAKQIVKTDCEKASTVALKSKEVAEKTSIQMLEKAKEKANIEVELIRTTAMKNQNAVTEKITALII